MFIFIGFIFVINLIFFFGDKKKYDNIIFSFGDKFY